MLTRNYLIMILLYGIDLEKAITSLYFIQARKFNIKLTDLVVVKTHADR